jgi:hypothetical protein
MQNMAVRTLPVNNKRIKAKEKFDSQINTKIGAYGTKKKITTA